LSVDVVRLFGKEQPNKERIKAIINIRRDKGLIQVRLKFMKSC